jgi:elongation factor 1-gamma
MIMTSASIIHSFSGNTRTYKVLVTAKYANKSVELDENVKLGITNTSADFLAKFPFGKYPTMTTVDGPLYESNALAVYFAHGTSLMGSNAYEAAQVQQFVSLSDLEVLPHAAALVYPILGCVSYDDKVYHNAKAALNKVLAALDSVLLKKTFLVGESVTFADIAMVCALYRLFTMILDPQARGSFINLTRWFVTCVNQPEFLSVFGNTELAVKEQKYDPSAKAAPAKPAAAPVPAAASHDDEEDAAPAPKPKNAMDLLPPSKFNLDAWKRFYSNNETRPDALNYFWDNFDNEGYSMYRFTYKDNADLTKVFMSSNLIGGFFQRLENLRKYGFGSVCVFGEDNNNVICGMFIIRGQEIPELLKDVPDYDSYDIEKVNSDDSSIRTEWDSYLAWDGSAHGKPFADGKIFK